MQTKPKQYFATLPRLKFREAVLSDEPTVSMVNRSLGLACARAALVMGVSSVVAFFNVGKTMDARQTAMTVDLIIERFPHLSMAEIHFCLREAMATAKLFDRLDGNIIIGWLADFDRRRDDEMVRLRTAENNAHKSGQTDSKPIAGTLFYDEYVGYLLSASAAGDVSAYRLLLNVSQTNLHLRIRGRTKRKKQ